MAGYKSASHDKVPDRVESANLAREEEFLPRGPKWLAAARERPRCPPPNFMSHGIEISIGIKEILEELGCTVYNPNTGNKAPCCRCWGSTRYTMPVALKEFRDSLAARPFPCLSMLGFTQVSILLRAFLSLSLSIPLSLSLSLSRSHLHLQGTIQRRGRFPLAPHFSGALGSL